MVGCTTKVLLRFVGMGALLYIHKIDLNPGYGKRVLSRCFLLRFQIRNRRARPTERKRNDKL